MKVLTVKQLKELLKNNPDNHYAIAEYSENRTLTDELMVTDGIFGATDIIPYDGDSFCWDFNINEYPDDDKTLFILFNNNDIAHMIKILASAFNDLDLTEH